MLHHPPTSYYLLPTTSLQRGFIGSTIIFGILLLSSLAIVPISYLASRTSTENRSQACDPINCEVLCQNQSKFSDPHPYTFASCNDWANEACRTVNSTPGTVSSFCNPNAGQPQQSTQPQQQSGSCPSGQWSCQGNCTDSATQDMFNNNWCNGQARWLFEAGCSTDPADQKVADGCSTSSDIGATCSPQSTAIYCRNQTIGTNLGVCTCQQYQSQTDSNGLPSCWCPENTTGQTNTVPTTCEKVGDCVLYTKTDGTQIYQTCTYTSGKLEPVGASCNPVNPDGSVNIIKCGDNSCNGGEWCGSCPQDCGTCSDNTQICCQYTNGTYQYTTKSTCTSSGGQQTTDDVTKCVPKVCWKVQGGSACVSYSATSCSGNYSSKSECESRLNTTTDPLGNSVTCWKVQNNTCISYLGKSCSGGYSNKQDCTNYLTTNQQFQTDQPASCTIASSDITIASGADGFGACNTDGCTNGKKPQYYCSNGQLQQIACFTDSTCSTQTTYELTEADECLPLNKNGHQYQCLPGHILRSRDPDCSTQYYQGKCIDPNAKPTTTTPTNPQETTTDTASTPTCQKLNQRCSTTLKCCSNLDLTCSIDTCKKTIDSYCNKDSDCASGNCASIPPSPPDFETQACKPPTKAPICTPKPGDKTYTLATYTCKAKNLIQYQNQTWTWNYESCKCIGAPINNLYTCINGKTSCEGDNQFVLCIGGNWSSPVDCPTNTTCNHTTNKCESITTPTSKLNSKCVDNNQYLNLNECLSTKCTDCFKPTGQNRYCCTGEYTFPTQTDQPDNNAQYLNGAPRCFDASTLACNAHFSSSGAHCDETRYFSDQSTCHHQACINKKGGISKYTNTVINCSGTWSDDSCSCNSDSTDPNYSDTSSPNIPPVCTPQPGTPAYIISKGVCQGKNFIHYKNQTWAWDDNTCQCLGAPTGNSYACTNWDTKCYGPEMYQVCINGQWTTENHCPANTTCNSDTNKCETNTIDTSPPICNYESFSECRSYCQGTCINSGCRNGTYSCKLTTQNQLVCHTPEGLVRHTQTYSTAFPLTPNPETSCDQEYVYRCDNGTFTFIGCQESASYQSCTIPTTGETILDSQDFTGVPETPPTTCLDSQPPGYGDYICYDGTLTLDQCSDQSTSPTHKLATSKDIVHVPKLSTQEELFTSAPACTDLGVNQYNKRPPGSSCATCLGNPNRPDDIGFYCPAGYEDISKNGNCECQISPELAAIVSGQAFSTDAAGNPIVPEVPDLTPVTYNNWLTNNWLVQDAKVITSVIQPQKNYSVTERFAASFYALIDLTTFGNANEVTQSAVNWQQTCAQSGLSLECLQASIAPGIEGTGISFAFLQPFGITTKAAQSMADTSLAKSVNNFLADHTPTFFHRFLNVSRAPNFTQEEIDKIPNFINDPKNVQFVRSSTNPNYPLGADVYNSDNKLAVYVTPPQTSNPEAIVEAYQFYQQFPNKMLAQPEGLVRTPNGDIVGIALEHLPSANNISNMTISGDAADRAVIEFRQLLENGLAGNNSIVIGFTKPETFVIDTSRVLVDPTGAVRIVDSTIVPTYNTLLTPSKIPVTNLYTDKIVEIPTQEYIDKDVEAFTKVVERKVRFNNN